MTIDEAIKHCLEEAGELQKRADSAELIDILDGLDVEACKECAADQTHRILHARGEHVPLSPVSARRDPFL